MKSFNARGFTLIESLVAITILVIGVLGPLTIAVRGISDGLYARNNLVAAFLAQEGVEVIRNLRDTALIAALAQGLGEADVFAGMTGNFGIDASVPALTSGCPGSVTARNVSPCVLGFSPGAGRYVPVTTQNDIVGPRFLRRATLVVEDNNTENTADDRLVARVEVQWFNGVTSKNLIMPLELLRQGPGGNPQ